MATRTEARGLLQLWISLQDEMPTPDCCRLPTVAVKYLAAGEDEKSSGYLYRGMRRIAIMDQSRVDQMSTPDCCGRPTVVVMYLAAVENEEEWCSYSCIFALGWLSVAMGRAGLHRTLRTVFCHDKL